LLSTILVTALLGVISPGATVCASIDTQQDTLTPDEQKAAIKLFESSLRQKGLTVVRPPCPMEFRLFHLRLGKSIQVIVQGPDGERMGKAPALEELPAVYSQLTTAFVTGDEPGSELATARDAVTSEQAQPRRIRADSLFYFSLGAGSVLGGDRNYGTRFGLGYRHELNQLAIDVSTSLLTALNTPEGNGEDGGGISFSLLRLQGLYFTSPLEAISPYFGGGLSWGATALNTDDRTFTGSGLQAEVTAGLSLLRSTNVRLFVEASATLPLYRSDDEILGIGGDEERVTEYTPLFGVSLGLGWGR